MTVKIYSIEGNIGSGKSTLVNILKKYYENSSNVVFMDEPVSIWESIQDKDGKNIIEKFYGDTQKYAFSFQMMAYISRISMLKTMIAANKGKTIICERSVYTDKNVFAKMLYDCGDIEEVNYQIYLKWFDEFIEELNVNGLIYVRADPEISCERVIIRNRKGETIPLDYLKSCHQYHENWIMNENHKTLILDANSNKTENVDDYSGWIDKIDNFIERDIKYNDNKLNYWI
jgi:deoxyadenosine/deoxycytidine kinase